MVYYDGLEKKLSKDWGSAAPPLVFFQLCVFRVILFPSIRTESLEQADKYHSPSDANMRVSAAHTAESPYLGLQGLPL